MWKKLFIALGLSTLAAVEGQTIVEVAQDSADFSTLVDAVVAAGLAETLSGEGPFTVFAPTNAAFAVLGEDTINGLFNDQDALAAILQYHVVAGRVMRGDLSTGTVQAVSGGDVAVDVFRGGAILNDDALITAFDIEASNGVIHAIDRVLIPPTDTEDDPPPPTNTDSNFGSVQLTPSTGTDVNLLQLMDFLPMLTTLAKAVGETDLVDTLADGGPYTIFAPTDEAFEALGPEKVASLLADEDELTDILLYHTVEGIVMSSDLGSGLVEAANGKFIGIDLVQGGAVLNENSFVTLFDLTATNGVIHIINRVLMPSSS